MDYEVGVPQILTSGDEVASLCYVVNVQGKLIKPRDCVSDIMGLLKNVTPCGK
jgi:hypothetical protein